MELLEITKNLNSNRQRQLLHSIHEECTDERSNNCSNVEQNYYE